VADFSSISREFHRTVINPCVGSMRFSLDNHLRERYELASPSMINRSSGNMVKATSTFGMIEHEYHLHHRF
jgi:hypothetical protein